MTHPLTFRKWKNAVDRASLRLWGITPEDGGWSEADLRKQYQPDLHPEEFARWFGEKYDLQIRHLTPLDLAYVVTPHWMRNIREFDALEIHPCAVIGHDLFGKEIVEQCEPEDAAFWTVYGHLRIGGVDAFEDFATEAGAVEFHDRLIAIYPHLAGKEG